MVCMYKYFRKYTFSVSFYLTLCIVATYSIDSFARDYLGHQLTHQELLIKSDNGELRLRFYSEHAVEVLLNKEGSDQLPSFAIAKSSVILEPSKYTLKENKNKLLFSSRSLTLVINKYPLKISYYQNGKFLTAEALGLTHTKQGVSLSFELEQQEKLLGGGERVLGMNRRGQSFPLYNRAHYGYTTHSEQMNFGLPAIMSSKKYLILFDNSAKGNLDLGKTQTELLTFDAVGGRSAYLFVAGDSYPKLIENYVDITGLQPLPPRWALGNFASRFGYHTEQEAANVVEQFVKEGIPLDAIIFDLYWFGKDLKGYMGNLEWDAETFPQPEKMIQTFKEKGVKTIMITEPFILTSSNKWQEALDSSALAKAENGKVKTFDFFFGNTSLVDVFSRSGRDWFWQYYDKLLQQGVEAWWGDLGEPEVHPADMLHALGTADELHNAYGHRWAQMIFEKQQANYPNKRVFSLMRSGFSGSQRFGMMPWTGDVSRSWGGLKPQVELSLQMGLFGLAYTHSDLGGFAGNNKDKELYIRWLQYGVFQPIFRPHGQEDVPAEVIFWDDETKGIIKKFIKLRYQLLPYNYSLAFENSTKGMPLMRPVFFEDESDNNLINEKNSYFWGKAFFVAPITTAKLTSKTLTLPKGVWFDYFSDERYIGGKEISKTLHLETLPVFVRAGSFIPMIEPIQSTKDYSSKHLNLHYYSDTSVGSADYQMYEDDGQTNKAIEKGLYELLNFSAHQKAEQLTLSLERKISSAYKGMPNNRSILLTVHYWHAEVKTLKINNELVKAVGEDSLTSVSQGYFFDKVTNKLLIKVNWHQTKVSVNINE